MLSDRIKPYMLSAHKPKFVIDREMLKDPAVNVFYGAPALIIIFATSGDAQAAEDCCLAAENLMLAAYCGQPCYVSGWGGARMVGFARNKSELGVPQEFVPVFPIAVLYPDKQPRSHGRNAPNILWL
ncbi:MAG: nitroreductase family protein [Halobacteriota archaeon]